MKQCTNLIAKANFAFRSSESDRIINIKEGQRFWVTTSESSNLRFQYVKIARRGKGHLSLGYTFSLQDVNTYFNTE